MTKHVTNTSLEAPAQEIPHKVRIARYAMTFVVLSLIVSLVYIPYEGRFKQGAVDVRAPAGYHFVWDPPRAVQICRETFQLGISYRQALLSCSAKPAMTSIMLTSMACLVLLGLIGVLGHQMAHKTNETEVRPK